MTRFKTIQFAFSILLMAGCTKNIPGDYPAGREAKEASEIGASSFAKTPIPCSSKFEIAQSLFEMTVEPFKESNDPTFLRYGVDNVKLKDGPGKAVVVKYSIRPGEPGGVAIITIHFYIDDKCHVSTYHRTEGFRRLSF